MSIIELQKGQIIFFLQFVQQSRYCFILLMAQNNLHLPAQKQQLSFYSITEVYHPKLRKHHFRPLTFHNQSSSQDNPENNDQPDPIAQTISTTFASINHYISNLQQLFSKRMLIHEESIMSIAHSQIKKVKQQSCRIIEQYSQLIRQKNNSQEILDLKYEVKYYQIKACELFQHNKKLKEENKKLKREIELGVDIETVNKRVMLNLSRKYLKEKIMRKNVVSNFNHVNSELQKIKLVSKIQTFQSEKYLINKHSKHKSMPKQTTTNNTRDNMLSVKEYEPPSGNKLSFFEQNKRKNSTSLIKQSYLTKLWRIKTEAESQKIPHLYQTKK